MKMKKVLSLALAAVMALGSFGFASAAPVAEADLGRIVENGYFGVGGLRLEDDARRQEFTAIILRLKGFKDAEVVALNEAANFKDVLKTDTMAPYIGKAAKEALFEGDAAGTFRPTETVNYAEMLVVLMRALGYTKADFDGLAWPTGYVLAAANAGIEIDLKMDPNASVKRGTVALAMEKVLDVKVKGGDVTLAQELGIEEVIVAPETLEVVSVSANNLKQVEVVFSKEVDRTSATNIANYTVTGQTVSQATLLADSKTVILTMAGTALQSSKSTVSVTNVQGKDLHEIAPTKLEQIIFTDVVAPTITDVKSVGNKQIVVTLSEPVVGIQAIDFKLNGKALSFYSSITPAVADGTGTQPNNQQYTFTFASALPAGVHELTFDSVTARRDAAGFAIATATKSLVIEDVTGAPTATISTATASNIAGVVKVTFDRPMNITSSDNGNFFLNTSANPATSLSISADRTVVTLTFGSMPVGAHVLEINRTVADAWGNIMHSSANPRLTFNAIADVETPIFESAVSPNDTTLRLRFNEVVDLLSSQNGANYEIKDANGTKVAPISTRTLTPIRGGVGGYANRQVDITLGSWLPGGTYTITVTGVKDTAGNAMAAQTLSFFVTDLRAPGFKTITGTAHSAVYNLAASRVEVFFNEPMAVEGPYSIIEKANWQFNGAIIPVHVVLYPGANNASVIFQFAATDSIVPGTSTFTINIAKDATGNIIAGQTTGVATANTVNNPVVRAVTLEAKPGTSSNDVLTFEVSQDLIGFDFTEFQVNGITPINGSVTGRVVTLIFPNATLGDGNGNNLTLVTPSTTRNADGAPIILQGGVGSLTADDLIPPTFVSAVVTAANQVTLTFNENLNSGLGATFKSDFLIDNNGATVAPASSSVSGRTVILQLATGQTFVPGGIVTVYPIATVENTQDLNGNVYVATAAQKSSGLLVAGIASAPLAPAFTINFAAEATTQVVPATHEYRVVGASTWTDGADAVIALTPGTNMEFRVKETGLVPAGATQTLVVAARPAAPTSGVTYNVAAGTVTGLGATYEYSISGGAFATSATSVAFVAGPVTVRTVATASAFASASETVGTIVAVVAPSVTLDKTVVAAAKFVGATTAMEYTIDGGASWLVVTASLAAGTDTVDASSGADIQVRVAATASALVSAATANLN